MKKISSYQKLKAKNRKLYSDIRVLIEQPNTIQALEIQSFYKMKFDGEESAMYGRAKVTNKIILN